MPKFSTLFFALAIAGGAALPGEPAYAVGNEDMMPSEASNPDYDSAVAAVKKEDFRGAIRLLARVLADDARNADALNYMGYSHRRLGDYKNAIAYYTKALEVEPDHRGANEYLGEAYLEVNDLPAAEARLERLRRICGWGCDEFTQLNAAVEDYKAKRKRNQSSRRRW